MPYNKGNKARYIIGIVLILGGTLFLLDNYYPGTVPDFVYENLVSWSTMMLIIGLALLINSRNRMLAYIFLFLAMVGYFPTLWPLVIVGLGIYLIIMKNGKSSGHRFNFSRPSYNDEEKINDVSIFGGGSKVLNCSGFRGGNVTSVFGGSELDLRGCTLADGTNFIDVFAMFGGSTYKIPSDWNIEVDIIPIFGGFSDKRIKDPNEAVQENKRLVFKGLVLFGGGEIKS